ncbi:MAG: UvrD-helicase domain-containing protein, partial [Pseudomonadota bacterium]|nr:UvrD-helicase domain-containing protein [Pseudomonadota bacterium]
GALGDELGGCDFTDQSQMDFLANAAACDVQAAPGNGKTTLLAAKLALVSRNWTNTRRGVCVISHTNAARTEVEDLIARHPTAARLMAYPHFTGTVTAFINQYLALPYLRGLGWNLRQIDDDAFEAEALRRYPSFWALKNQAKKAGATVERWVARLTLDPAFDAEGREPDSIAVQRLKGQHGGHTACGQALAKLKASMVRNGLYRYADMTALAWRALAETPALAARLRDRFPLVMLDEAQDTHGDQLRLLEHIFKHDDAAFQRLGDTNQTLYEDNAAAPVYWQPEPGCIPLDTSRRFGGEIAGFASQLTIRQTQTIVGIGERPGLRLMILFDEATIGGVLGAFAKEAEALWGADSGARDVWAVASRHKRPKKKGAWVPRSLVDYPPDHRTDSGARAHAQLLWPPLH